MFGESHLGHRDAARETGELGSVEKVLEVGVELLAELRLPLDLMEGRRAFRQMNSVVDEFHKLKRSLGLHVTILDHVRYEGVHVELLKPLTLVELGMGVGKAKLGRLIIRLFKFVIHIVFEVSLIEILK